MDWPYVNQLQTGDEVKGAFLVASKQLNRFSSGDKQGRCYLSLTLKDNTGIIQGRVWNNAEEVQVEAGEVVLLEGAVGEYRGVLQVNIRSVEKLPSSDVDLFRFLPKTQKDMHLLNQTIQDRIKEIHDPHLHKLLHFFFSPTSKIKHKFSLAPGGKSVHHAYAGGLMEHSLEVVELCRLLSKLCQDKLNRDLLIAGALLHDIGKIEEYNIYNPSFTQTDPGLLKGHIVLGLELVQNAIAYLDDFPKDLKLLLEHMILSHHGKQEWGSPVEPKTIEAITLHYADLMSSKINHALQIADNHSDQGTSWTKWDRILNGSLYIGDYLSTLEKLEAM